MKDFFKGVRKHIDRLDAGHLREQYKRLLYVRRIYTWL